MGFNSGFKGLRKTFEISKSLTIHPVGA